MMLNMPSQLMSMALSKTFAQNDNEIYFKKLLAGRFKVGKGHEPLDDRLIDSQKIEPVEPAAENETPNRVACCGIDIDAIDQKSNGTVSEMNGRSGACQAASCRLTRRIQYVRNPNFVSIFRPILRHLERPL